MLWWAYRQDNPRSWMRWHSGEFNASRCLTLARKESKWVKRGERTDKRTNERTNERASERASDRKLSISKSIWPGLPIGCRLISRWIVSNMGILLMARWGIGCTSNRPRVATPFSRIAQIYRSGLAICSRIRYSGLNALWCCCNDGDCTAVSHIRV
jgi:hypothetical protein